MTRLFQHRINTVEALEAVPPSRGVELDLRSSGNDVLVTHDPFTTGPRAEDYFPHVGPRPCIFNVKTEGIEDHVVALAAQHGITDYFFLDLSVPAAVKQWRKGNRRIAVRYSELEPAEGVLAWKDKASWVWVDCFTRYPTEPSAWDAIARAFQVCLVSPELQGHDAAKDREIRESLASPVRLTYHAVCTKKPASWGA